MEDLKLELRYVSAYPHITKNLGSLHGEVQSKLPIYFYLTKFIVRTMLEAIISFMPSEGAGAIGALDWTKEERHKLAKEVIIEVNIAFNIMG